MGLLPLQLSASTAKKRQLIIAGTRRRRRTAAMPAISSLPSPHRHRHHPRFCLGVSLSLLLLLLFLNPHPAEAFTTSRGTPSSMASSSSSSSFILPRHHRSFIPHFSRNTIVNPSLYVSISSSPSSLTSSDDEINGTNDINNDVIPQNKNKNKKSSSRLSPAAQWHQQRRKDMIAKYGKEILDLEKQSSQYVGLPLLLLGNLTLLGLSLWAGSLSIPAVVGLAIFPGSIFSLWQLQILHDCLHGTLLDKRTTTTTTTTTKASFDKQKWQQRILFWGSLPCVFGYYLYLQYGHLSHHKSVGSEEATLQQLFDSSQVEFEDGDVLFVAHRMNLKGPIGPRIPIPTAVASLFGTNKADEDAPPPPPQPEERPSFAISISRSGFHFWKSQQPIRNAMIFATSFLFERYMLCWNDVVVALTGRNFFFPNKPDAFHQQCATYTRCAVALRLTLFLVAGWKSLLFLYLSETLWSIPPHPACAMFITNHGSKETTESEGCRPTSSTYAGAWYSVLTLGTNYHCEHHDFPSIPFHLLGRLHQLAPEFYSLGGDVDPRRRTDQKEQPKKSNVFQIMKETFAEPDFYACSNANQQKLSSRSSIRT